MTQSNLHVANQSFPNFRSDLNTELRSLATNNMGATEPTITYEGMWWFDTTSGLLRIRNKDNTGWISVFDLSAVAFRGNILLPAGNAAAPSLAFSESQKTGIYRIAADVMGMTAGASGVVVRIAADQVRIYKEIFADLQVRSAVGFRAPADDGPAKPGYSWDGSTNTGIYRLGADMIGFSSGGLRKLAVTPDRVQVDAPQLTTPAGTKALPGLTIGGTTIGFRLGGDGNVYFTFAGTDVLSIRAGGLIRAETGAQLQGDGSGISPLNANAVLSVLADAALADRGTFALLTRLNGTTGFTAGLTYAGSDLRYAGIASDGSIQTGGNGPSGSWMALGYCGAVSKPTTLFKRV